MEWWQDARLGMFIHWGLYSVYGGIYEGLNTDGAYVKFDQYNVGGAGTEWIQKTVKIPTDVYLSRLKEFNSSQFDPEKIAQMAKDAGMKYIVITSKHHEGLCLWNSKSDPLNITRTSADHDILKRLKKACSDRDLKFGIYFSQSYDWSTKGVYGQEYYVNYTPEEHEEYIDKYVIPVIDELFEELDPDILWYDIPYAIEDSRLADKIYNHVEAVKKSKLIVNDRLSKWHKGDFETGEGDFYHGTGHGENCNMLLGSSWGYGASYEKNNNFVTPQMLILTYIVGAVTRGQNSIINIAPRGDGSITQQETALMNDLAKWMTEGKDAIRGCTRALEHSNPQWGRLTINKKTNKIYLITSTRDETIYLDGIATNNLKDITTPSGQKIKHEIVGTDRVYIPKFRSTPTDNIPYVLVAHYDGEPNILDYTYLINNSLYCSAFWGDGVYSKRLIEENNKLGIVAWWSGGITSRIKFNSESGTYKIKINLIDKASIPRFKLILIDSEGKRQSANVSSTEFSNYFDDTFTLKEGQVYSIALNKTCNDNCWLNFSNLEFEKQ